MTGTAIVIALFASAAADATFIRHVLYLGPVT